MTKPRLFGVAKHDGKVARVQRLSEGRTFEEYKTELGSLYFMVNDLAKANKPQNINQELVIE